jgi:hypothetical protein
MINKLQKKKKKKKKKKEKRGLTLNYHHISQNSFLL